MRDSTTKCACSPLNDLLSLTAAKKKKYSARALLSLSAAEGDSAPKLQRTVHALELQSLPSSSESPRAFPSGKPPSASAAAVVVVNFSEEGSSSAPAASLVVVQAPVGDADAAAVAAELSREIAAGVVTRPESAAASVLLLAALRVPNSSSSKSPSCVLWGGCREGFPASSGGSSDTLPRDARISDGFVSALALSLSLSMMAAGPSSPSVALAAVDGHRPPVTPLFSSSSRKREPAAVADESDLESLEAASALGEAAAGALGLHFSRARAARLVPSRAALLEAAALSSSSALSLSGAKAHAAAAAPPPPLPLLQGAELMYG